MTNRSCGSIETPPGSPLVDEAHVTDTGLLGSYRREIGWGRGRKPGARIAIGPELGRARITPAPTTSAGSTNA